MRRSAGTSLIDVAESLLPGQVCLSLRKTVEGQHPKLQRGICLQREPPSLKAERMGPLLELRMGFDPWTILFGE